MKKYLLVMLAGVIAITVTGCGSNNDKLTCKLKSTEKSDMGIKEVGMTLTFKGKEVSSGEGVITFESKEKAKSYYSLITSYMEGDAASNYKQSGNKVIIAMGSDDVEEYKGKTKDELKKELSELYNCK